VPWGRTVVDAEAVLVASSPRYRSVGVARIVPETHDAVSLVLDIPAADVDAFAYRAGQFLTLRAIVDGQAHLRSYSMSSAPAVDAELQVTVKRVPGGLVSNWVNDTVRAGDRIEVSRPAGSFVVDPDGDGDRPIVAFAAGSGITPVFSIVNEVLASSDRRVRLLYANRDRTSTIFGTELDGLAARHPDRLVVRHHLDVERGFVGPADIGAFLDEAGEAEHFVCGPGEFMAVVEATLVERGVDRRSLHVERFTPDVAVADEPAGDAAETTTQLTIRLAGRRVTVDHRPGTTLLQAARSAGLRAPSSCETGSCATCMARITEGAVRMRGNEVLTPEEVAEGWVLTCQSEPTTPTVAVVYE
jgi:3-ketosteroid 9alpha-monooxygenase subunit B